MTASAVGTTQTCSVVAVVLRYRDRIGMFKRSPDVGHDGGLWHCITGYLDPGVAPLTHAMQEIFEETGLTVADLDDVSTGPVLALVGDDGARWQVHTFSARTAVRRLNLNWEHDSYRWVRPYRVPGFAQVRWLGLVLEAVDGRAEHRQAVKG